MKTIITIVLMLLTGSMLTSCDRSNATETSTPPGRDPITVLEEKVEVERQLRAEAEALASDETTSKNNWQLASFGLGLFAVLAFFTGTSIGTRGRYHADLAS
jgi:hypothetical protein